MSTKRLKTKIKVCVLLPNVSPGRPVNFLQNGDLRSDNGSLIAHLLKPFFFFNSFSLHFTFLLLAPLPFPNALWVYGADQQRSDLMRTSVQVRNVVL